MEIISTNNNALLLDDGSGNVSYSDIKKTTKDFRCDSRQKLLISNSSKGKSGGFNNISVVKTCAAAAPRTSLTCPTTHQQEYCAIDDDNDYNNNNWDPGRKVNADIDSGRYSGIAVKLASNPVTAALVVLSKEEQQRKPISLKFEEKLERIVSKPLNSPPKFKIVIKVPSLKDLSSDTLPSLSNMMLCRENSEKVESISTQRTAPNCQNQNTLNAYRQSQPSNVDCSFQTYRNIRSGVNNLVSNNFSIDTNRYSITGCEQSTLNTFGNNCDLMITCDSNNNFASNSSVNIVNTAIKREFFDEDRSSASSTQSALTCISSPVSSSPSIDFPTAAHRTSNFNPLFATDYSSLAQAGLVDGHHHYPMGNFVSVCSNIISQDNIYASSDNCYLLGVDGMLREEKEIILPNSSSVPQQTQNNNDNNESNTFCRPVYDRLKLERKRERNRAAATKCRRRKLERISLLQNQVDEISQQNELLRSRLLLFADDVCRLRRIFENHRTNGCLMGVNFDERINSVS